MGGDSLGADMVLAGHSCPPGCHSVMGAYVDKIEGRGMAICPGNQGSARRGGRNVNLSHMFIENRRQSWGKVQLESCSNSCCSVCTQTQDGWVVHIQALGVCGVFCSGMVGLV